MSRSVWIKLAIAGAVCAALIGAYLFLRTSGTGQDQEMTPSLPVVAVTTGNVITQKTYPATIEGEMDVEIRPQVDGYLGATLVDEGDFVVKGATLFKIEDFLYREQYNEASANFAVSEANLEKAAIELEKARKLAEGNIISGVQLKSVEAGYKEAQALLSQAKAMRENARIRLEYTNIKAPADGLVGRLPFRKGSLISVSNTQPLTTLSHVDRVRAYFSISEQDYIPFMQAYSDSVVVVSLRLANGETYPLKGEIDAVNGLFEKNTGSISVRATFPNPDRVLRSGNTGSVSMEQRLDSVLLIPQESTFRLQDKTLVYLVGKDNKILSRVITVNGKSDGKFIVTEGLAATDRILASGMNRVQDGMQILPVVK